MWMNGALSAAAPRFLAMAAVSAMSIGAPALGADSQSDLFQPDALRTGAALRQRTGGMIDPDGNLCAISTPATEPLTLTAAVDLALCRNPTTRAAWAAARQQAAAFGNAKSAWLPTVSVTGSETRTYGNHVDVSGALDSAPQDSHDAALNLNWTLYDFGNRSARIKSARLLLDAAAASVDSASQQTVFAVVQGYFGVVAADATQLSAQATTVTAARSLEIARALRSGGVASLSDVLQSETAYDTAVLGQIQADAAARSARGTLAVVLGAPADTQFTLAADAVPAEVPMLTERMSDLMAEASRQRPDLAAALAQRDAAAANVTVARALGRPSISVQGGRSVADTTGVASQNYNQVGIYLTVPIFSGFSVAYGVRQAQALLEASEVSVEQARLTVSLSVWNAYYALDSENQQLTATATLIKTAQDNEQVAQGRYKSGVGTIVDVLTAQSAASSARLLRISAEYGWQVARAQLTLALGRLTGAQPLTIDPNLP